MFPHGGPPCWEVYMICRGVVVSWIVQARGMGGGPAPCGWLSPVCTGRGGLCDGVLCSHGRCYSRYGRLPKDGVSSVGPSVLSHALDTFLFWSCCSVWGWVRGGGRVFSSGCGWVGEWMDVWVCVYVCVKVCPCICCVWAFVYGCGGVSLFLIFLLFSTLSCNFTCMIRCYINKIWLIDWLRILVRFFLSLIKVNNMFYGFS